MFGIFLIIIPKLMLMKHPSSLKNTQGHDYQKKTNLKDKCLI